MVGHHAVLYAMHEQGELLCDDVNGSLYDEAQMAEASKAVIHLGINSERLIVLGLSMIKG